MLIMRCPPHSGGSPLPVGPGPKVNWKESFIEKI